VCDALETIVANKNGAFFTLFGAPEFPACGHGFAAARTIAGKEKAMRSLTPLPLCAALVAGCAGYAPSAIRPGQSVDDVVRAMGEPTGRHALAQGSRLEYARGPFGKHTFMIDVDAQGRVTSWQQVLTERTFEAVATGISQQDLLATLGRPSDRRSGGWQGGEVWSYRYDAVFCQWFQVSVKEGRITSTGYAPDPLCDVDRDHPS
jgi:hypothetical protein